MSIKPSIAVIIPCYNEGENIPVLVERLNEYFSAISDFTVEVIFVDDGSHDDTFVRLSTLPHVHYRARLIRLARNSGTHIAFRAGLLHAESDMVTATSADLQHPLTLIHDVYKRMIEEHTDLGIAFRKDPPRMNFFTRTFSRVYTRLIRKFAVANYPDEGFDVFMVNKKIKDLMNQNVENNSSILLQVLSFGLPISKVYYNKLERHSGKSKWTFTKKLKLLIDSFVAFSYAPIRLVSIVGITFFIVGFLWSAYIIYRKLVYDDLAMGWPTLVSVLMIGFGLTNISLGIIAEYLWRTLDASRSRPVFVIDKLVELTPGKNNHDHAG